MSAFLQCAFRPRDIAQRYKCGRYRGKSGSRTGEHSGPLLPKPALRDRQLPHCERLIRAFPQQSGQC